VRSLTLSDRPRVTNQVPHLAACEAAGREGHESVLVERFQSEIRARRMSQLIGGAADQSARGTVSVTATRSHCWPAQVADARFQDHHVKPRLCKFPHQERRNLLFARAAQKALPENETAARLTMVGRRHDVLGTTMPAAGLAVRSPSTVEL